MTGLTDKGLTIPRLPDIITDLKSNAEDIFSDLVAPGDQVDTSDVSAIGRMISVIAPGQAVLWEQIQLVFSAFNLNSATGVSLDNLAAFSGIPRLAQSSTQAQVLLTGANGTVVTTSAAFYSPTTKATYRLEAPLTLSPSESNGISASVSVAQNNTNYSISYSLNNGASYVDAVYRSDATATLAKIQSGLTAVAATLFQELFKVTLTAEGLIVVEPIDPFQIATFKVSSNMKIDKVTKAATVASDVPGPFPETAYGITTISVPQAGLESIKQPSDASTGRNKETDDELRSRIRVSRFERSTNLIESQISALRNIDGVTDVVVYENVKDVVDARGLPPHSYMSLVRGGLNSAIAKAIFDRKPAGIATAGSTSYPVINSQGDTEMVYWQRPIDVPLYVKLDLTKYGNYPADGDALVKQSLVNYITSGFGFGDTIIYSRLYTPINAIPGHQVNSLLIGTSPDNLGTSNIPLTFVQAASLSADNIVITSS